MNVFLSDQEQFFFVLEGQIMIRSISIDTFKLRYHLYYVYVHSCNKCIQLIKLPSLYKKKVVTKSLCDIAGVEKKRNQDCLRQFLLPEKF